MPNHIVTNPLDAAVICELSFGRTAVPEDKVVRLLATLFGLVVLATVGIAQIATETRPDSLPESSSAVAAARGAESGPSDPTVQLEWKALTTTILALRRPSEAEVAAVDAKVRALESKLEPLSAAHRARLWTGPMRLSRRSAIDRAPPRRS